MRLLKFFTTISTLIIVLTLTIASYAAAIVFKDQGEIDKLTWAKDAIKVMAEKGIITGMDGGNFNPNTPVKKLDSLIITSKILGAADALNKAEVDKAETTYGPMLVKYNLPYGKREVSYLIYRNVLVEAELDEYLSTSNIQASMMRHEAAVLLVKALGKEQEVKNKTLVILPFIDQSSIPEKARPYADYLQKQKIMNGVSDTEFSPFTALTRAQMSVLLSKVMALLPEKEKTDEKANTVSTVKQGYISILSTGTAGNKLTVRAGQASDSAAVEYIIPANAVLYKNDTISNYSNLETGDTVSIELNSAGNVLKVSAKSKNRSVGGTIKSIIMDHPVSLVISGTGFEETLQIANPVTVTRNNIEAAFQNLKVGDVVKAELVYNIIQEINATAVIKTLEAVLEEMVIAAVPRISVKDSSNNVKQYYIVREPTININGEAKTFYDLRVGMKLKLSLDSETVVRLDAEQTKTVESYTGVIEAYNSNLKIVTLNIPATPYAPAYQKQIYFKTDSLIVTDAKTGSYSNLNALKSGLTVTVFGNNEMGVFVATQIILISK